MIVFLIVHDSVTFCVGGDGGKRDACTGTTGSHKYNDRLLYIAQ